MSTVPVSSGAAFFRGVDEEVKIPVSRMHLEGGFSAPHEKRNVCRWCLNVFDPDKQERSTRERGALRSHLMMADNGSEIVCCDNCWQGAIGAKTLMAGRVVPCEDPNEIPNILLMKTKLGV